MQKKKKGSFFIATILLGCLIASLITSVHIFTIYAGNFQDKTENITYDQYYVLITENREASFWQSVYKGCQEMGREKNIYVELFGDNLTENYNKEQLMQMAIASRVDGIIVEADDSEEMTALINEAAEAGIAVVTVYGDNPNSNRCSYVGVGSYNLGREYGSQVLKIAEGKDLVKAMVLINANKYDYSQNVLCSGIRETIEKEKTGAGEIEVTLLSIEDSSMFSAEESIRSMFMAGTEPDVIICLDELTTVCVYQAVVDYNRVGEVDILGYYDSDTIVQAIDRNVIAATISVKTEQMGRDCVEALKDYIDHGYTNQYHLADVTLINKDNVAAYLGGEDERENP